MPTKNVSETVTRCVDVCDFCTNECASLGSNRCAICDRIACYNHADRDRENLLSGFVESWICSECNRLGIVYKQTIRRLKEQIATERRGWKRLCVERSKRHDEPTSEPK